MFGTLLEPAAFFADADAQRRAVAALGGPFFATDAASARDARAAGLPIGLLVDAPGGVVTSAAPGLVAAVDPEIVALRIPSFGDDAARAQALVALAASLAALAGRHRMLVAIDAPLPPLSAAAWASLPAESLLIDPIADPDAWRSAATLPGDRGLLLGLVDGPGGRPAPAREVLLWGLGYAASLGGRGRDRVGVVARPARRGGAPDSGDAAERLALVADLVRLSVADAATLRAELDPRATSPIATLRATRRRVQE